jgi:hypothetical protein
VAKIGILPIFAVGVFAWQKLQLKPTNSGIHAALDAKKASRNRGAFLLGGARRGFT